MELNVHPTDRTLTKDYLSKILWVQVQTKEEPARVCVVLPQNCVDKILKDEHRSQKSRHSYSVGNT
jgi:hypothetical protein